MIAVAQRTESEIASAIRAAYRAGAIEPFGERLGVGDVDAAYRVQNLNTEVWLAEGRTIVGRKIGLTSKQVQAQLGVDQPDYGMLFGDMRLPDGAKIPQGLLLQPKVEVEVALSLRRDLTDPATDEAALLAAIDWLAPAIEIVDSRVRDWRISLVDTIADNASSGLFVLGEARRAPGAVDVVGCTMRLRAEGRVASRGAGVACLGSPYIAALWLARKMIAAGRPLHAGDIVLTGALGPMVTATRGTTYTADIDGFGAVSISF
jgi:2-keto-4-pentenoate hydratase